MIRRPTVDDLVSDLMEFAMDTDERTPYDRLCDVVRNATIGLEKHLRDINIECMRESNKRIRKAIILYELEMRDR